MRYLLPLLGTLLLGATAGCTDPNRLPGATISNLVDTVTISALRGTGVTTPSGYSVSDARTVRTDQTSSFDFAYDVDGAGRHLLLPRAVLGIDPTASLQPGLQPATDSFDLITRAPSDGYITTDSVAVASGERYYVRSRVACSAGLPQYGKLEVLSFDDAPGIRTITFQVLTNNNCGYRGLRPGLPTD